MSTKLSEVASDRICDLDLVADPLLHRDPEQRLLEVLEDSPQSIMYTPKNGGHWIVNSHKLAHQILNDPENFGSFPIGLPANYEQRPRLIPLESPASEHRRYRRLLLPVFQPASVNLMTEDIRAQATSVLDEALVDGELDFLWDIAKPIPTRVFADSMGLEKSRLGQFYEWENGFYRADTLEERMACGEAISAHMLETVEARAAQPGEDIVSLLLSSEVEGERLSRDEVHAIAYLLFLAGIDTVASMLTFTALQLSRSPELFQRLKADPELLEASVDEFLRLHSFINMNRICERDVDFHGVRFRAGDNIVIPTLITSRDAEFFPDPHEFNEQRSRSERNKHHAFGGGPHKCIGLHLAKLEVTVVLQEFCKRVATLSLVDETAIRGHGGTTMGLECLPVKVTLEQARA